MIWNRKRYYYYIIWIIINWYEWYDDIFTYFKEYIIETKRVLGEVLGVLVKAK